MRPCREYTVVFFYFTWDKCKKAWNHQPRQGVLTLLELDGVVVDVSMSRRKHPGAGIVSPSDFRVPLLNVLCLAEVHVLDHPSAAKCRMMVMRDEAASYWPVHACNAGIQIRLHEAKNPKVPPPVSVPCERDKQKGKQEKQKLGKFEST